MSDLQTLAEGIRLLRAPVELPSGRMQTPSARAIRAVEIFAENGGNKAMALREAGFSEVTAENPIRVFGSPTIQAVMREVGVGELDALKAIKRNVKKRMVGHLVFPLHEPERASEHETLQEETGADMSERIRGESMTDADIRAMFAETNIVVSRIVHGDTCRHVYFWTEDSKAQLTAADMMLNITGSYAPKQMIGKFDHRVGIYSMKALREKMRKEGVRVVDPMPREVDEIS